MKVFILLSAVVTVFASNQCGTNEHWESCGTTCPLTCENYDNPPWFCVLRCDIGCFCNEGYVRSSDGRCIKPEECRARSQEQCGENQRYSTCATACPLTCENYDNPPLVCPAICIFGCECEKGFVKTKDGRCVRPEDCPSQGQGVTDKQESMSACDFPAETGVCTGFFPRYFFDRTTNICRQFIYGGCGGNQNNFGTEEECKKTCAAAAPAPSACRLKKVVGSCKAHFVRYFYNTETEKCEEFIYGGCDGNSNNFNSLEDCEAVCMD